MILIENGTVVTRHGPRRADVLIEDGRIIEVSTGVKPAAVGEVVDAGGCLVGPGFVDLHVHLREPGQTWKEDIESGSRAAAAGGFTAVVAMPNTVPAMDDVATCDTVRRRGVEVGIVDVVPAAAVTVGRRGEELTDLELLYNSGVRVFSDDGDSVADDTILREAMKRLSVLDGAVLSQHAEDHALTAHGHMHAGEVSKRLGVGGLPSSAEWEVVARDLTLVAEIGARYHCQHVSAAETVALIREAKATGLPVSAEVTPHHMTFETEDLRGLDTNLKMYPPIRESRDRDSLRSALRDATIDVVATDHAPHSPEEKDVDFEEAPRGVIGLETAAAVAWEVLGEPGRFFDVMSVRPARIGSVAGHGLPIVSGQPANLVVFDPKREWTPAGFASKSSNSPYLGRPLCGKPVVTIFKGEIVHRSEEIT